MSDETRVKDLLRGLSREQLVSLIARHIWSFPDLEVSVALVRHERLEARWHAASEALAQADVAVLAASAKAFSSHSAADDLIAYGQAAKTHDAAVARERAAWRALERCYAGQEDAA